MAEERDTKEIVQSITDDIKIIVQGQIELARAEIMPSVKHGGVGAGIFGGAGYFALNGLSLLFIAGALGIAVLIKHWWALGFAIMGVVLLLIAGLLALIGRGQLAKAKANKPTAPTAEVKAALEEVKGAIKRGNEAAKGPLALSRSSTDRQLEGDLR